MARWLTVLIALLAQGMALMSPVCFIRCVGADGHECVEVVGLGCHRCSGESQTPVSREVALAACCSHCDEEDSFGDQERQAPDGWQVRAEPCSCRHSPMELGPQNLNKLLASEVLSQWHDALPTHMAPLVADLRVLDAASFRQMLLRPHESPQLAALTTVVLRV